MAAPAAGFQSFHPPLAEADHARFFKSWLRRIAPDTHQDQASGDETTCHPGGFAAPEERWCRNMFNGFIADPWLPVFRHQSLVGSRCGRSARGSKRGQTTKSWRAPNYVIRMISDGLDQVLGEPTTHQMAPAQVIMMMKYFQHFVLRYIN